MYALNGISNIPTDWLFKVNPELLYKNDEEEVEEKKGKGGGKKGSEVDPEANKWWLTPKYSVSLFFNGNRLNFYKGMMNENVRNTTCEKYSLASEDAEVGALPEDLYNNIKSESYVRFDNDSCGMIFVPADVVVSLTGENVMNNPKFIMEYEIVRYEDGQYPEETDLKIGTGACEGLLELKMRSSSINKYVVWTFIKVYWG